MKKEEDSSFNTVNAGAPDWGRIVGTELYDHDKYAMENVNAAEARRRLCIFVPPLIS